MALIDVSQLLTDPDFVNSFIVLRSVQGVDDHGRTTESQVQLAATGSVQPAGKRTYEMFPEAARVSGALEVYTMFRLSPPTEQISSDELAIQPAVSNCRNFFSFCMIIRHFG